MTYFVSSGSLTLTQSKCMVIGSGRAPDSLWDVAEGRISCPWVSAWWCRPPGARRLRSSRTRTDRWRFSTCRHRAAFTSSTSPTTTLPSKVFRLRLLLSTFSLKSTMISLPSVPWFPGRSWPGGPGVRILLAMIRVTSGIYKSRMRKFWSSVCLPILQSVVYCLCCDEKYVVCFGPPTQKKIFRLIYRTYRFLVRIASTIARCGLFMQMSWHSVRWSICLSQCMYVYVGLLVLPASPAKTAEPIDVPFGDILIWAQGTCGVYVGATWWIRLNGQKRRCCRLSLLVVQFV